MLKGRMVYKGNRGASAYEVAVENGFVGSEAEWLATLGTSIGIKDITKEYEATAQTSFELPTEYIPSSILFVYVDGIYRDDYTIELNNINFISPISGKVKIIILNVSQVKLPIENEINAESTESTVPSSKAIYDYFSTISVNEMKNFYEGV